MEESQISELIEKVCAIIKTDIFDEGWKECENEMRTILSARQLVKFKGAFERAVFRILQADIQDLLADEIVINMRISALSASENFCYSDPEPYMMLRYTHHLEKIETLKQWIAIEEKEVEKVKQRLTFLKSKIQEKKKKLEDLTEISDRIRIKIMNNSFDHN